MLMPLTPKALSGTMIFGGLAKLKVKQVSLSRDANERAGQAMQPLTELSDLKKLPSHGLQAVDNSFAMFPAGHGLQRKKTEL